MVDPIAPSNLRTVSNYATSTTLAWDLAIAATSYEVWVTDAAQSGSQPVKSPVNGTSYTVDNLLPNHPYHFQVYSVLDADGVHLLSPTAAEKNGSTESIIIVDVVDCPPSTELATICPLTCGNVTVESPNIVRWSTFSSKDFHKIRIKARSTGTILAQAVLERTMPGGVLHVRNMMNLMCDNTQLAINPPKSTDCPTGVPPLSFCGTFPFNSTTVSYRVEADIDKCVVRILAPAVLSDFIIEAECCNPPQPR